VTDETGYFRFADNPAAIWYEPNNSPQMSAMQGLGGITIGLELNDHLLLGGMIWRSIHVIFRNRPDNSPSL